MNHPAARALACVLLLAAAGCSSDPARFYTLSATATPAAQRSNVAVAVGPVSVPAALDRPQIVVTSGANQVTFDEFNRWASPLQENVAHVVAENLAAMLGTSRVSLYTQTTDADVDYRVRIEVRSFESVPGKSASLIASWTVRRTKDGKSETGRTSASEAPGDASYDALAAAHSRALARLSQDIAQAVSSLVRTAP
jgi:hypothetical protein